MSPAKMLVVAACVLPSVGGCGDTDAGVVTLVDYGELCLFADAQPPIMVPAMLPAEVSFAVGSRLHVTVGVPECLSSSCDVDRRARCRVIRSGQELTVRSELSYHDTGAEACTMDCGVLYASCQSEPLEAGTYRVTLGSESRALTVPSSLAPCQ